VANLTEEERLSLIRRYAQGDPFYGREVGDGRLVLRLLDEHEAALVATAAAKADYEVALRTARGATAINHYFAKRITRATKVVEAARAFTEHLKQPPGYVYECGDCIRLRLAQRKALEALDAEEK
jgi:hypothetical protein